MDWIDNSLDVLNVYIVPISLSVGLFFLYSILRTVLKALIKRHARKSGVALERELYIRKLSLVLLFTLTLTLLGAVWEISFQGLSLYFASIFTVVGVGLFATWSILSNLTASIVLFFFFPYRIGHKIKILDGDNSVEGIIMDISLFYIKVKSEDGTTYSYPNNLAIQKAAIFT